MRKGEIACSKQFLLFSQCFLSNPMWHLFFILNSLKMLSAICFNLDQSNILSSGNGLKAILQNNDINVVEKLKICFC